MAEYLAVTPEWFIYLILGLLGLNLGSFANVLIYRMPIGKSVVIPRSACPNCEKMIPWFDNIPVFSFLFLGGKCRNCKTKIRWRYPIVEMCMALLFMGVYYRYGISFTTIELLIFVFAAFTASIIDIDHMILPDEFTLGGLVIALLGAVVSSERELMPAIWGMLLGGGFFWAIAYLYWVLKKEEGLGGGDIKLMAWIGALLGWKAIPFVILSSSVMGSVIGLSLVASSKGGLKTAIPYGPYILLGALIYIYGGDQLANWYISLFIPSLSPVN